MTDELFFKRKESIVIKDFETAFKFYEHLHSKIITIRQWTITLMIASMGFFMTNHLHGINIIILVGSILTPFLLFELRERSSMRFDKIEILELERIFMLKNTAEYEQEIEKYEYRDLRLAKLGRAEKCKHMVKSILKPEVAIWLGSWILIWTFVTTNYNPSDAVKSPTDKKINPQEVVVKEPPSKIESLVKTKNQGIKESQVKNVN